MGGLGAFAAIGGVQRIAIAASSMAPLLRAGLAQRPGGDPILQLASLGDSELVGGVPFAKQWFGDVFAEDTLPFHTCESCDEFPAPSEFIDVAIVGGGLSGLMSAYALRGRDAVVFELRPRMGGNCIGESFGPRAWSLASAYFMQPDAGTDLERLYSELGLPSQWRLDNGGFSFEWQGQVVRDLLGPHPKRGWEQALARYAEAVQHFANEAYPEIPFEGRPPDELITLDTRSFHEDLRLRCGGALPPRLAYMLQAYCYSSFGVGFDELSAAAGWNFVAAEEFGRCVMPAGNAGLARVLWDRARHQPLGNGNVRMRNGALVAAVTMTDGGVLLHWRTHDGERRTTFARQVVMANAKHICRHMLPWLEAVDPEKLEAMRQVPTVAYVVANVLLDAPLEDDFYDLFVGGGRGFPMDANAFEERRVITDAVNANFTQRGTRAAFSMYWPLPWHTARFSIVNKDDWRTYAAMAADQLRDILPLAGLRPEQVTQVRLARWGHAMPFAVPGAITGGVPQLLRRPIGGRLWFANQDNWSLPAVETALGEAMWVAAQVDAALG